MSTGDHDDELSSLFAKERRAHPSSAAAKARVWSRLEASLGPSGGGNGAPAASAPSVPPPPVSRVFVKLAALVCLVGAGGAIYSQLPENAAPIAARAPASSEHAPRPIVLAAGTTKAIDAIEPPTAMAITPAHVESTPVVVETAPEACAICDEQRILDAGRSGLREKHYDAALAAIHEHESRFPRGQLAEERESLRVHVLVAMGRTADADMAKSEFRRSFPGSPLLDSVNHAGDTQ